MDHRRRHENRQAIVLFVTVVLDQLFKAEGVSSEGAPRKRRRGSEVPLSLRGLEILEENREVSLLIMPIIREMTERFPIYALLIAAAPLEVGAWRRGRTSEDRIKNHYFYRAVKWIEGRLEERHPGIEIYVDPSGEYPADSVWDARWDDERRKNEAELRRIYLQWMATKVESGVGSEEAKRIMRDRPPYISPKKTERAITFVNRERAEGNGHE